MHIDVHEYYNYNVKNTMINHGDQNHLVRQNYMLTLKIVVSIAIV